MKCISIVIIYDEPINGVSHGFWDRTFLLPLQMKSLEVGFQEGDVILTNHPAAGGSHLPDLTVITPVFYK